jgi:hypothetical protein
LLRADREDVTAQREALTAARAAWAAALDDLVQAAGLDTVATVEEEARALARALRSRAKNPPPVDSRGLAGAVSAAHRYDTMTDEFDRAVEAARVAEQAVDLAAYDLRTASGEDG